MARWPAWLQGVPGARSLHRQLLIWLLLPQLVLWMAGAYFTYDLALRYANRAIDASLLQATKALARQVKPIDSGMFIDFPRSAQEILEADPNDRVFYTVSSPPGQFILGNLRLPAPAIARPALGEPYFYNDAVSVSSRANPHPPSEPVRVAALYLHFGIDANTQQTMLVQVARSSANRQELTRRILFDTVLPLSGVILLMSMIVWTGIRAGLAPLALLQRQVEGQAANLLAPIQLDAAPPEVRALAGALNALLAEVNRNVSAQKRFLSDAAHQLRTPLAGLKSQTELALKETSDPALLGRLQRVHESATRSAHLVNQLLTLARAEPESASLQDRHPVDLLRLAHELTAEYVPRALQAGIDLGVDELDEPPVTPLQVNGIALLLREALANLIDNALRYAGRGATVTVRVRRDGAQALIEVEDNGPGVPEGELGHVVERFVRATHDGSGCGLGLAIAKEIIERHAGTFRLLAVSPHGLIAQARLPALPPG